jgi:methylase of polypeptide subunit release factors
MARSFNASEDMDLRTQALIDLGRLLKAEGYSFITSTPLTHSRVLARPALPVTLRGIFGWNQSFDRHDVSQEILALLEQADALEENCGQCRSKIRFATIGDLVFLHSGFPTMEQDAVFFGPDTYRFVRLLRSALQDLKAKPGLRVADIGAGSGAGGVVAAKTLGPNTDLVLGDINAKAIACAEVNLALNDVRNGKALQSDVLSGIQDHIDIIVANPPYLVDSDQRTYRHGGGAFGEGLTCRIVEEGLERLAPGGRLVLYSGATIIAGEDLLLKSLQPLLKLLAAHFVYEEIDPDVFGEELESPPYAGADRIAAVGLTIFK